MDASVVSQLACPVCFGNLNLNGTQLLCGSCGRAYPVIDGIPVLVAERAQKPAQEKTTDQKD